MKIWYVTMQFPSPSETFAGTDVRALKRLGADVSVHSLRPPHAEAKRFVRERGIAEVRSTHGGVANVSAGLLECLRRPKLAAKLFTWLFKTSYQKPDQLLRSVILIPRVVQLFAHIERERPEVVHLFWGHYPAMVAHLVQSYLPQTVVSVFLGAYDLLMGYGGSAPVARTADAVWTHAQENTGAVEALGVSRDRLRVVYRGVDLSAVPRSGELQKTPKRIVSAGRLIASKGMDEVIRIFQKVKRRWSDASLTLIGDGPERNNLEALVRSLGLGRSVTFLGHVSQEMVLAEMRQAEVFLLMSKKLSERLPNVVKEAVACRCLCIVTQTPGIEELLRDQEHGFVIEHPDEAAAVLEALFSGRVNPAPVVEAAYAHLTEAFDVDSTMARYFDTWKMLVTQKQPDYSGFHKY